MVAMTLVDVVTSGDVVTLRRMLSGHDVDVNCRLKSGETLLHLAITRGDSDVINVLLEHGADANAASTSGEVPLHQASARGLVNAVRALYAQGADPEVATPLSGESNLHLATRGGHVDLVDFLLQHGARINVKSRLQQTPLGVAAASGGAGGMEVVRTLLEGGASANGAEDGKSAGRGGAETPLHLAVGTGDAELVRLLAASGANVNAPNLHGLAPLHLAVERGDTAVVKALLEQSAHTNCKGRLLEDVRPWIGERRYTPLHIAATRGHVRIVDLLLDAGANVDMPTTDFATREERPWCWIVHRETALHLAADSGHTKLVKLLTRRGADLANIDIEGNMPHHLSLHSSHYETLHALLVRGSCINEQDGDRHAALHQAVRLRDQRATSLLIMHGAALTPRRKPQHDPARSVIRTLAADRTSDPDIFLALYYSGNPVCPPLLHNASTELLDLKLSPERRYIYDWLCEQEATVQSLKVQCRWYIRKGFLRAVKTKSIWILVDNLPVPRPIKRYLLLADHYDYPVEFERCPVIHVQGAQYIPFSLPPVALGFDY